MTISNNVIRSHLADIISGKVPVTSVKTTIQADALEYGPMRIIAVVVDGNDDLACEVVFIDWGGYELPFPVPRGLAMSQENELSFTDIFNGTVPVSDLTAKLSADYSPDGTASALWLSIEDTKGRVAAIVDLMQEEDREAMLFAKGH